jgi:hypothetical protein
VAARSSLREVMKLTHERANLIEQALAGLSAKDNFRP